MKNKGVIKAFRHTKGKRIYDLTTCIIGNAKGYPLFFFKDFKDFIYLFLEREKGREKEGERSIYVWLLLMRPLQGPGPQPKHVP